MNSSVQLVEQELWQREEKGLIGILPVRDAAAATAETASVGPTLSHSKTRDSRVFFSFSAALIFFFPNRMFD
jgi:hypothetical protein